MSNSGILSTPDGTGASIEVKDKIYLDNTIQVISSEYGNKSAPMSICGDGNNELRITSNIEDRAGGGLYLYPNTLINHSNSNARLQAGGWALGSCNLANNAKRDFVGTPQNGNLTWCGIPVRDLGYPGKYKELITELASKSNFTAPFTGWCHIGIESLANTRVEARLQNLTSGVVDYLANNINSVWHMHLCVPCVENDQLSIFYVNATWKDAYFVKCLGYFDTLSIEQ
jgi:hypothetical protein